MTLREVMSAIETIPDVSVVLDLSVHALCEFNSNCPKAIQLRQLIGEAGINMGQILQGYAQITSTVAPKEPVSVETLLPDLNTSINGNITIGIMGHLVPLDLTEEIKVGVTSALHDRLRRLNETRVSISKIASSLYGAYTLAIDEAKKSKVVKQVQFPVKELLANKVISNKGEDGGYNFYIPVTYEPKYLIYNGVRYELHEADKIGLRRDNLFLEIVITGNNTFVTATLIDKNNKIFQHYHGRGYDCWGTLHLPERWDGSVRQLQQIVHEGMGSLVTINLNSILNHHPEGMPVDTELRARATKLGKEGEITESRPRDTTEEFTTRIRWGG